jgi:predicted transcriptional regulator
VGVHRVRLGYLGKITFEPMSTLKVGIASYEDMKARTMRIARGERPARGAPKVWFTSTQSFAKVLSAGNRQLLRIIAEKAPGSLDELAELTGRKKSAHAQDNGGLWPYPPRARERGRIAPKVTHNRVELELPLTAPS